MVIRMTDGLLVELKKITPEEESILAGRAEIEKDIYMSEGHDTVEAKRLLDDGKLIQVRTHTRFVHFPRHTHNYIEVIYMCSGSTHHVIDGKDVFLQEGEVLLLNQKAVQEIYPAGMDDVAVNFIVLPEFFDCGLKMMGEEKNLLRDFVIDCLKGENGAAGYIHFKVADILPIQNLLENLIWSIWHRQPNKRSINQITMGLLFLQLMNYTDRMETGFGNRQQGVMISVLGYVEEHYRDGELSELAGLLHCDFYWLSREIKKITGRNYTDLVQEKRLNQAIYLLENTNMSVMEIGMSVGYENVSYFHRIFQRRFGVTPRRYRVER